MGHDCTLEQCERRCKNNIRVMGGDVCHCWRHYGNTEEAAYEFLLEHQIKHEEKWGAYFRAIRKEDAQ